VRKLSRAHPGKAAAAGAWSLALAAAVLALSTTMVPAQTGYRYRDANGQWVFTDQAPASATPVDSFSLGHENSALHLAVDRSNDAESAQLIAVNDCLCVVTFEVSIVQSGFAAIPDRAGYRATLAPGTRRILLRATQPDSAHVALKYAWRAALGSPDAVHQPTRPYRVPFGVGSTYLITQAYPSRITHTTADSQYAVDIALPDGTPVYAAREGTVINARHDYFRGAIDPVMLDQANVVQILHSDGTIGVYAHLHWDSIRVRIGAHVVRGEYIADSGNTGFTSGPHLHFAVIRSAGATNVSVPVEFAGIADVPVTPITQMQLTAY
jgi:murein DD-endopeptidase MepM/ murein hydrolase activator NlpD